MSVAVYMVGTGTQQTQPMATPGTPRKMGNPKLGQQDPQLSKRCSSSPLVRPPESYWNPLPPQKDPKTIRNKGFPFPGFIFLMLKALNVHVQHPLSSASFWARARTVGH
eukprot:2735367-Amphidinium_carterae.1